MDEQDIFQRPQQLIILNPAHKTIRRVATPFEQRADSAVHQISNDAQGVQLAQQIYTGLFLLTVTNQPDLVRVINTLRPLVEMVHDQCIKSIVLCGLDDRRATRALTLLGCNEILPLNVSPNTVMFKVNKHLKTLRVRHAELRAEEGEGEEDPQAAPAPPPLKFTAEEPNVTRQPRRSWRMKLDSMAAESEGARRFLTERSRHWNPRRIGQEGDETFSLLIPESGPVERRMRPRKSAKKTQPRATGPGAGVRNQLALWLMLSDRLQRGDSPETLLPWILTELRNRLDLEGAAILQPRAGDPALARVVCGNVPGLEPGEDLMLARLLVTDDRVFASRYLLLSRSARVAPFSAPELALARRIEMLVGDLLSMPREAAG